MLYRHFDRDLVGCLHRSKSSTIDQLQDKLASDRSLFPEVSCPAFDAAVVMGVRSSDQVRP